MNSKTGKILLTLMLSVLFMLPAFCAFAAEGEQTEAISLSEDSVTIGVGETVKVLDFITDADKATNTYIY